ncbi:MAG: aminotransferase class I/II-fold pyridoxal phosphate-dependent enzyme [Clostridia bacterium]|nr:aminotransferase class I/II-fold pyridoxal phosphate-dependent enzyme [Clostridia bacterium]
MLINQKNPHGGDIYTHPVDLDFSANLNPYGMPQSIKTALAKAADDSSAYPDPYCRKLKERIAAYEDVEDAAVLCGNGAAELIYSFCYALDKEKPALVIEPTFCAYSAALRAANVTVQPYYLRKEDGFRLTKDILQLNFSAYSAVFLCAPNNPTGFLADKDILCAIAASSVRMLLDVSFLELTFTPQCYDIPALVREFPNICILRSMTKSFAMAGVRLGYALSSDTAFLEAMAQKVPCWNVSTPAQLAGMAALEERQWLRESAAKIRSEKEELLRALKALGVYVFPGEANYLLLYSQKPLAKALLQKGILVRDCSNFAGLGEGYVRIAVRTPGENRQLLAAIGAALRTE